MSANQHSSVRIISGNKRGSKIHFDLAPGLRPSGDRIREVLFAWLQIGLPGCHCLDMFAGSGALGFEAASRGAASVVMLEKNRSVVTRLQQNIDRLEFENVAVVSADAMQPSTYQRPPFDRVQFDLVFIDPPFSEHLHQSAINLLQQQQLLCTGGFAYIERAKLSADLQTPANWELHREKIAGDVKIALYRVIAA